MLLTAALRITVLALTAALSTCHAPPPRTTTAAQEPAPAPPPRTFDPDVVRPDPASALGRALAVLDTEPIAALTLVMDAREGATDDERARLTWVAARAAHRAGVPVRAATLYGEVAHADHPLAPWARLRRAQIVIEGDAALAADEIAPLTELEWAGRRAARELHASALLGAERPDEAEPLLQALLDERSSDGAHASVAMPLAELLFAKDDLDAKREAIALWRRVVARSPLSRAGREAETRAEASLAALPPDVRAELGEPSPADGIARAEAIAARMRHDEAAAAFAEVARRTDDPALRCEARIGEARAVYRARERTRAAELLSAVADDCDAPDVRAWGRYLAGRALTMIGQQERALDQYAALEREVPDHRLADDARFRSALIDADRGDFERMTERLRTLPEAYPEGDMHGEARFMLAWRARSDGRLEEALAHLEASLRDGPGESAEDILGRAAYWRAAVLAEIGRDDAAREAWMELVRELPLSYYSQQALVRSRELGPEAFEAAQALLGTPGSAEMRFAWHEVFDTDAFARAVELFKVGEVDPGREELATLDLEGDDALRWLEAALLDRAGAHSSSVYLTRVRLDDFRTQPPSGEHFARWRIAYPAAYAPLLEQTAEARALPAQLIRAIAREESSFRPDAVSVAHAYGLVQVILPTARRFARRLELTATPQTMVDPAVNLAIGAEFMKWLWDRYESNPAVLPSAYNAGQGATDRWLRQRPDQRLDEWVEDIPYDETRRYTRRVLQSWGVYSWLADGELPALRAELPPAP